MDPVATATLWTPSAIQIEAANITRFADFFRTTTVLSMGQCYEDLHGASVQYPGAFWKAVWEFCEIGGEMGETTYKPGRDILDCKWFPEAQLNFSETLLKPQRLNDPEFANSVAIVATNETGDRTQWTRRELYEKVCQLANFLKSRGVVPGDRVVAVIPNIVEAVIGLLATAAIGGVWSSCSPEFGDDAVCDRFGQIGPKVILTAAECHYASKVIYPASKITRILSRLPTITTILVIGESSSIPADFGASEPQWFAWERVCNLPAHPLVFEPFPFDHPLCIVYSSGTTGVPKCIVHGVGGTVLQHRKEHSLHCNLNPKDLLFFYTTTGWMMWNWLVSGLGSDAGILLFDGSPFAMGPGTLWQIAAAEGVTHFGASPRYYMTLEKDGYEPASNVSLNRLECVLSTGSPLPAETFDWIYRAIGPDICLASISGGTDILSCFVLGNPALPVIRGTIQCKGLGMDVRVFNDQGESIIGTPGELVCASPFPSMPVCFWNDPDGAKYKAAYFDRFEGVWCHGDWAQEDTRGGFIIYGRSDATLNPSGVRIGTAEIYQQVESFSEIAECLATVLRSDGDEQIVLFVRMQEGKTLTRELRASIRQRLKERCSSRHVPRYLVAARDFPRTMSGKLSEIAVRSAINNCNLGNSGALANPESLDFFRTWKASDD